MKKKGLDNIVIIILLLAVGGLFLEYGVSRTYIVKIIVNVIDFSILALFAIELVLKFIRAEFKREFFKKNLLDILFFVVFTAFFVSSKYIVFTTPIKEIEYLPIKYVFIRNIFFALKLMGRFKRLNVILKSFTKNPAQTMLISFLVLILTGTVLLMLPYATADGSLLGFVNAFFTATSAVCVTGLIVVDTATYFSLFGKIVIMALIQCGGLGIMIFTSFTAFLLGKKMSLEDRITLSYILNERDLNNLYSAVLKIVILTFVIEICGALILYFEFVDYFGHGTVSVLYAVFHSISAFCNAGFALFSDNFEQFKSDTAINMSICMLIILGGISFAVLTNVFQVVKQRIKRVKNGGSRGHLMLTVNTKIVLTITFILLVSGVFIFYGIEHRSQLMGYDLKTQYLAVFFESVTLRTAGFNTINMSVLRTPTYLVMILFMFIGGAAGSTAGGIKVNTLGIIYGYVKSMLGNRNNVVLFKHAIAPEQISRGLIIFFMSILAVFTGAVVLSVIEQFNLIQILFEVVSAFGTVGLSTGITPALSAAGKLIISGIMFLGRLGPLTIITALSVERRISAKYPDGYINIG